MASTESDSARPLLDGGGWRQTQWRGHRGCCSKYRNRIRRLGGRATFLVLLWNLLVFSYQFQALSSILKLLPSIRRSVGSDPWKAVFVTGILQYTLPGLLYPIAGWLADVKFGRYKVIRASMLLMWVGSVVLVSSLILQYKFTYPPNENKDVTRYLSKPVLALVYIVNAIGIAGFHANIIPFGLDQMEDGSTDQYSAFIHWYYWTRNFSLGVLVQITFYSLYPICKPNAGTDASLELHDKVDLIVLIVEVGFLTLALCLDFLYSNWLIKEPKTQNPLKAVVNVTWFILRHNQPVGYRSAFTYSLCEAALPSRSKLATRPYGGPFDTEDVEAVKTFWYILVFLLSLGGMFIVDHTALDSPLSLLVSHTQPSGNHPLRCFTNFIISNAVNQIVFTVLIPVYEFIVYPLFRRYVLTMLKRIGLGMMIAVVAVFIFFVLDLVGHHEHSSAECMFYQNESPETKLHLDPRWLILPVVLMSLGEFLVFVPGFEFICAQSPYSMRGFLIGLFYCIYGLFIGISGLILLIFAKAFQHHKFADHLSCGSSYYLAATAVAVLGMVIYFVAARWYRRRQRGGQEFVNERAILESYYENAVHANLNMN